jgi:hypothetical protein
VIEMKVIIESSAVRNRSGVSAKGRPYSMNIQRGLLKGERSAGEIEIILDDGQQPYPEGEYTFDWERCITIGSFGSLRFSPVLVSSGVRGVVGPVRTGTAG